MTRRDIGEIVHHRKARSTGATITVERTGEGSWIESQPGWMTIDLSHSTVASHDTRATAVDFAAHPEEWCGDCQLIAAGKRPRIEGSKVR